MDKSINFIVPIDFPTPCLSIYSGLQEFFVFAPVIDALMLLPHSVTPHV
jgi:hypothetical protein